MAAHYTRAADDKNAHHRIPRSTHSVRHDFVDLRFRAAAARTRMDRGSYDRDRIPLGRWKKRTHCRYCCGVCAVESGSHRYRKHCGSHRSQAGDIGRTDRLCCGRGSSSPRSGRVARATGRHITGLSNQSADLPGKQSNYCAVLCRGCGGWPSWPMLEEASAS